MKIDLLLYTVFSRQVETGIHGTEVTDNQDRTREIDILMKTLYNALRNAAV